MNSEPRQLKDFSSEVLARFIQQEFAVPFSLRGDQWQQKLVNLEAQIEWEKNHDEISRLIEQIQHLTGVSKISEWMKVNKQIDALRKRQDELFEIAYPDPFPVRIAPLPTVEEA